MSVVEIREDLDIAVIGLAGRFPGSDNCREYWRNLLMGVDGISHFTDEELLKAGHDVNKIRNKDFVAANGVLGGAQYFDAEFFGYSQAEAALMDPQTRLMLECVWHALENAGVDPDKRGRSIGLFLGARSTVQWTMQAMLSEQVDNVGGFLASQLANKDAMSTLISWKLGLQGPSFTMQTACSTSLVSIHQAVQSLLNGECDFAVAGGVSLLLPQQNGHLYQEGMLFSKDGKTRAFDADASGSVFGSGLGAVVLRRAGDAIADNDPIWAILKGSAINNDGARKVGYTAPSVKGQAEVIRAALQLAEVDAADVDFIECHGTATGLGDSIEFMALREVFGESGADSDTPNQCALGAVKSNIGHLDSAAGVAGFIKMVLALKHGVIPPTLHFLRPNPQLDFEKSCFYVNTEAEPWLAQDGKLRTGGVSSFGIGGTNAHIVLQEYAPASQKTAVDTDRAEPLFFPFSAVNTASLTRHMESVSQWLVTQESPDLRALSHTLRKRHSFPCRALLAADSQFALMREIERYLALAEDGDAPSLVRSTLASLTPEVLNGMPAPLDKDSIEKWLSGVSKELPRSLWGDQSIPPLKEVPGYAFAREDHGAGHVSDKTWGRIADVLSAPEGGNLSKNAAGMLTPFWKSIRLRKPPVQPGSRRVLLAPASTEALTAGLTQHDIEVLDCNPLCSVQLRGALAELAAGARSEQALTLTLAFPADGLSMNTESLQALADLGRALTDADFSGYASVHIYLLAPSFLAVDDLQQEADQVLTTAALKSLALVAPQEIPGIACACVEICNPSEKWTPAALASVLASPMHGPLKLSAEGLFVEDFRSPDEEENEVLDASHFTGGTFVITGAGGRMARAMAKTLAQRFQGRLALISRQSADSPAMQNLRQELTAAGAGAVEVFPYALESESDALALFESIRQRLGAIQVVIHAAGVTDGDSFAPLAQLDADRYLAQLAPKARVAQTLARVFESAPVETCFVTSSMSAFFGGIAHAPYAAANLFLDGWSQRRNNRLAATRWVTVNWETIHFEEASPKDANAWGANETALLGAEFPALFERSLREFDRENQKIFSAGQFSDRLYSWGGRRPANGEGQTSSSVNSIKLKPRPATVAAAFAAPGNALQEEIAAIWSGILGVEGVGVDDRFMELGGDSLKTIVMAEKVYKKLGKRIAIQDFFAQPTIREIERQCLLEQEDAKVTALEIDPAAPILASADQELLYIHQTTFQDASYNMPVAFECPASYSPTDIAAAIEQVADRHLALKCLFKRQGANLMMEPQVLAKASLVVFESAATEAENRARLEQFAAMPFDLQTTLPIRAMMITSPGAGRPHQVLIVVHHIVCDAVSLGILADDLQNFLAGRSVAPLEYSYAAFRQGRQAAENEEKTRKDKAFWLANLLPLPAPLALPRAEGCDDGDESARNQGATRVQALPRQLGEDVKRLCEELGLPTFTFFLGAFGVLMSKIARTDALLLGVPVTGRTQPEEMQLVGYLVNMLALKLEPEAEFPVADYLLDLNEQWAECAPYQTYPMSALLQDLSAESYCQHRQGKHPLFDVVFGYLPQSLNGGAEEAQEAGLSRLDISSDTAKFDLVLEVSETRDGFDCTIQYREHMFEQATILALFQYYFELVGAILADPETEVGDLLQNLEYHPVQTDAAQMAERDVDLEFDF
ncbi:Polyketide synthase modules and related protein [Hahella chejuensis KCTC 2396]|uniref:Polyketide synthase modules and related protein n=1 Tax=Hahella chejuensis (strain KCTC 2396) TaxID=349521 RepID=Q2SGN4_HAHCH|nr:SDR family NAD(P)-dependent oxidoreductase [Hahella chejuensis]ABC30190.1 Polyketide synthase modules and related protein [Hahella chejuensis KCTC 2396]